MKGITFIKSNGESRHTFDDWDLILKTKPDIEFPEVKTNYIDIAGSDGQIDLTEVLTGQIPYKNRVGSLEFSIIGKRDLWQSVKSIISDWLHGQKVKMILDEDPQFFYVGRMTLNKWKSDKKTAVITIDYNLEPYKYELFSSTEDWLWDSFNFESGYIRDYRNIRVNGHLTYELLGARMPVVPTFIVQMDAGETEFRINVNNYHTVTESGTYTFADYLLKEGKNIINFYGNGYVTIEYRGGRL